MIDVKIENGIPVGGYFVPTDERDTYPITTEEFHRGGYRSAKTVDDMNDISDERRKQGMLVYVIENDTLFRLNENNEFIEVTEKQSIDIKELLSRYDENKDYVEGDIVFRINEDTGKLEILTAIQDCPIGTDITDEKFWKPVYNSSLMDIFTKSLGNLTYKGKLADKSELSNITDMNEGDLYLVGEDDFYIYVKDEIDEANSEFKSFGGNSKYTSDTPTTGAVGGIEAGVEFNNEPIVKIIDKLLHPYLKPKITKFSIAKDTFELGESTGDNLTISWEISNKDNIEVDSIKVSIDDVEVETGLSDANIDYVLNITPLSENTPTTATVKLSCVDIHGETIRKTLEIKWVSTIYYGSSMSTTIDNFDDVANLTNMQKIEAETLAGVYDFPTQGYKYIIAPASLGDIKVARDTSTDLKVPFETLTDISIVNLHGATIDYKVYKSVNLLHGAIEVEVLADINKNEQGIYFE